MISVIVATLNRPSNIASCLKSLLNNSKTDYEIIIIDQSKNDSTYSLVKRLNNRNIHYLKQQTIGKSRALNIAINNSHGHVLAFTDDDCIVDNDWLKEIYSTFHNNQNISVSFGKTLPYNPKKHSQRVCPSCFNNGNKIYTVTEPEKHWLGIGFGNNMAFKHSEFIKLGMFKTWLGPGSIGSNAEDAELSLRTLIKGGKIIYNPNMIVYHNKWLDQKEMIRQQLSYNCGEMACYGYFAFQEYNFAKLVVKNNLHKLKKMYLDTWMYLLIFKLRTTLWRAIEAIKYTWFVLRGLLVGLIFSYLDPIK